MECSQEADPPGALPADVPAARLARRNYLAYALEGIFFMCGTAFVDVQTLMPPVVQSLGGPTWLISLMPTLAQVASPLPMLMVLPIVSRLTRYAPYVRATMLVQRLPYLLAGLGLLAASVSPGLALVAVALAPLLAGIGGGLCGVAWSNLMYITIPPNRRTSLMAVRAGVSAVLGIGVGVLIRLILDAWPGTDGYAVLHFLAFASVTVSLGWYLLARDPPNPPPHVAIEPGLHAVALMWGRLVHDRRLRIYLVSRILQTGVYVLIPFLSIYTLATLEQPQSYLGHLLILQTIGAVLGNVVTGYVGDRIGTKVTTLFGMTAFIGLSVWSTLAATSAEFSAIFFLLGFGLPSLWVSSLTLGMEMAPQQHRSVYMGLMSLVNLPALLLASTLSGLLWWAFGSILPLAVVSVTMVAAAMVVLYKVPDPRKVAA